MDRYEYVENWVRVNKSELYEGFGENTALMRSIYDQRFSGEATGQASYDFPEYHFEDRLEQPGFKLVEWPPSSGREIVRFVGKPTRIVT